MTSETPATMLPADKVCAAALAAAAFLLLLVFPNAARSEDVSSPAILQFFETRRPTMYGIETGLAFAAAHAHRANVNVYTDLVLNHNGFGNRLDAVKHMPEWVIVWFVPRAIRHGNALGQEIRENM